MSETVAAEPQVTSHISAEMTAAIGTELGRRVSYPVSESDIRRWALAVYYPEMPPARFLSAQDAAGSSWGGLVAPEEFNPFAWLAAETVSSATAEVEAHDPGRTEKVLGLAAPDVKFQLNGGMEVTYGVPMRPGDVITAVNRLGGYHERTGRLGLMLITTFEDTWTNQNDETVKQSTTTLIRY